MDWVENDLGNLAKAKRIQWKTPEWGRKAVPIYWSKLIGWVKKIQNPATRMALSDALSGVPLQQLLRFQHHTRQIGIQKPCSAFCVDRHQAPLQPFRRIHLGWDCEGQANPGTVGGFQKHVADLLAGEEQRVAQQRNQPLPFDQRTLRIQRPKTLLQLQPRSFLKAFPQQRKVFRIRIGAESSDRHAPDSE